MAGVSVHRPSLQTASLETVLLRDDVETLHTWLEQGLEPDCHIGNVPLLHVCARSGAVECMHLLVHAGADVQAITKFFQPAISSAILAGKTVSVHCLLSLGTPAQHYSHHSGNLLHTAASSTKPLGDAIEIIDRLLVAGADMHQKNHDGKTPLETSRNAGYAFICQFRNRYALDAEIRKNAVDKNALQQCRRYGGLEKQHEQAWVDMPVMWAWLNRILPVLESKGEKLSYKEATLPPERLAWIVAGGSLPVLNKHLLQQGEPRVGIADFVGSGRIAKPALIELCRIGAVDKLLKSELVEQMPVLSKRALYAALPSDVRAHMPEYYQIMENLKRQAYMETVGHTR
jgi:hypothetical protein